jgi:hypothetical protein
MLWMALEDLASMSVFGVEELNVREAEALLLRCRLTEFWQAALICLEAGIAFDPIPVLDSPSRPCTFISMDNEMALPKRVSSLVNVSVLVFPASGHGAILFSD